MPTRIVLDTTPVPSQLSPRRREPPRNKQESYYPTFLPPGIRPSHDEEEGKNDAIIDVDDPNDNGIPETPVPKKATRRTVNSSLIESQKSNQPSGMLGLRRRTPAMNAPSPRRSSARSSGFHSSLLRELSVRNDAPSESDTQTVGLRISSNDIRASPRFLGYLFSTIAGSVLLVSVVQFYLTETDPEPVPATAAVLDNATNITLQILEGERSRDKFYRTNSGDLVYKWKLWGAIYSSAGLVGICILIMAVHYDTLCLPKMWMAAFRDGSLAERNLILLLMLLWSGALHICTSSLSVGQVQANVFFTSWIAFASISLTYGVWRESAGLPTMMDKMNQHFRETTYNWIWIMIFDAVFAGAATDIYYNRDELEIRYEGQIVDLQDRDWIIVLTVLWGETFISFSAILFNEWFLEPAMLPCCRWHRKSGTYRCVFGWRQFEGLVMLAGLGAKFWVILEYTGVDGVINGLGRLFQHNLCLGYMAEGK